MKRRGFLGLLGGLAAGAVLDPERLLWVPGAKLISIPAPKDALTLLREMEMRIAAGMGVRYPDYLLRKAAYGVSQAEWMRPKPHFLDWRVTATMDPYEDFIVTELRLRERELASR